MILDARDLSTDDLRADVCIIGAGAAGITLALELADRPLSVCVLESGGAGADARTNDLNRGHVASEQPYLNLDQCRLRYFGGSTNHWTGLCHRLEPIDFERRDWVPLSGWPIAYDEVAGFYRRAHEICEIPEQRDSPAGDQHHSLETGNPPWPSAMASPFRGNAHQPATFRVANMRFSPPTRFAERYRTQLERAANIQCVLNANATGVIRKNGSTAIGQVVAVDAGGRSIRMHAQVFVLATGGIENARLLLAWLRATPILGGPAADWIGRTFMEHPHYFPAAIWLPHALDLPASFSFARGKESPRRAASMLVASAEAQRKERMLGLSLQVKPIRKRHLDGGELNPLLGHDVSKAETLVDKLSDWLNLEGSGWRRSTLLESFALYARAEQAPNRESRVVLADDSDGLGVPRARLEWQLDELDGASLRKGLLLFAREVGQRGLGRVLLADPRQDDWTRRVTGGCHHIGTTRMSRTAEAGVVDVDCRVHGLDNLYVAGSSVFPTAGWANPTLTIVALAVRLARRIDATISR